MNKKQKLAKLLPILERMEYLEKVLATAPMAKRFNPVVYEGASTLLSYRKKDGSSERKRLETKAWRDKVREGKIVRAARALMLQFDEDSSALATDIGEKVRNAIENINPGSPLTPKFNLVASTLQKTLHSCLLTFEGLYENFIPSIFAQGRFHQTLYNPREKHFKRYATFSLEESAEADKVHMMVKADLESTFTNFSEDLVEYAMHLVKEERMAKEQLLDRLEHFATQRLSFLTDLTRAHLREAYAAGNLYQLAKDKVELVRWQSGQHVDDCGTCRAIQMGDILLEDAGGNTIKHVEGTLGGIAYYLEDIVRVAKEKGASYFNHDGCRCSFVPY